MKIICIGRNYANHAKEMNAAVPTEPLFFMKPDTALHKEGDFYYPDFTKDLHYEVELVIKIKKVGKYISKKNASKYYDSVGLGIDFTARDIQKKCKEAGHPWERAKAFDNSAALSQHFLPLNENTSFNNLSFSLKKNGETVQDGNTQEMIFPVDDIIAYVSQFITLKTGDLIYTGTPEGVGPIAIGDQLEGFIGTQKMFDFTVK